MVKITNFDHLTTAILKFWPWSWSKMANFDHLTTDNLKFWPWSWSQIFDHLTMTPGCRPNGQKIMVILPPPVISENLDIYRPSWLFGLISESSGSPWASGEGNTGWEKMNNVLILQQPSPFVQGPVLSGI